MKTVGIICEYNPFHLGHKKQIDRIRQEFGPDTSIVCAMSGNFVQRGHPALVDKSIRAEAALRCGADLVLELPVTVSLSSAEGFAQGGVEILSRVCDTLCFGAESADGAALMHTAEILCSSEFELALRKFLETGLSFPAARQAALAELGGGEDILRQPNDILAVEYCKAIRRQGANLEVFPIRRQGSYHAQTADRENPSATAVRALMLGGENWQPYVPEQTVSLFDQAPLYTLAAGERAVLGKLRTMTDEEFEALPYGSEGLWRKLMHASRKESGLEEVLTAVKSKRYTRTRLDRMVMCAFLGITREMMQQEVPYTRVLAFNSRGREILNGRKKDGWLRNAGERMELPHWQLEKRCGDLYGLFCTDAPEPGGTEERRRVRILL